MLDDYLRCSYLIKYSGKILRFYKKLDKLSNKCYNENTKLKEGIYDETKN